MTDLRKYPVCLIMFAMQNECFYLFAYPFKVKKLKCYKSIQIFINNSREMSVICQCIVYKISVTNFFRHKKHVNNSCFFYFYVFVFFTYRMLKLLLYEGYKLLYQKNDM